MFRVVRHDPAFALEVITMARRLCRLDETCCKSR